MNDYAHPNVLVSTDWVADNLTNADVALVEVNVDTTLYDRVHIPGAVGWSWKTQLCNTVQRDILSREELERLMSESGIEGDSTVVLYGDSNNWFAAWAYWQLAMYGHRDLRIMDGGRKKWEAEKRPMTIDRPVRERTNYRANMMDASMRAMLSDVQQSLSNGVELVDVRSPQEFTGEVLAPPGLPETCQRGGHVPGARNIPWVSAVNDEDGTFKTAAELREIYRNRALPETIP